MADKESNLSLENARRIAKILRPLTPQARNELLRTKSEGDFGGFQKVAFENRLDASSIWTGIDDLWQQTAQGVEIPLDNPDTKPSDSRSRGVGIVGVGAAAAGTLLDRKEGTYERFQEDSGEYGKHAKKIWEEEEKERLKNPDKFKPKPGRAISAQEAYDRAHREYHEMFARTDERKAKEWLSKNPSNTSLALAVNKVAVENKKLTYSDFNKIKNRHVETVGNDWEGRSPEMRSRDKLTSVAQAHDELYDHLTFTSPKAVKEWADKYNDPELKAAIERKRQRDETQAIADQGRLSRALGLNPAAKFAPTPGATTPQSTSPRASLPILNPEFKVTDQETSSKPENTEPTDDENKNQKKQGIRGKLFYYSPSQIRGRAIARAKARILNSRFGQKLKNSRLGKLGSRLNKFKGGASKLKKRLTNLLNPLSYLINLLKKSILGSILSAITSVITSMISFAVSLTVGIATVSIGVFSAAVGIILSTIGLPIIVIILIVGVLFIVFALSTSCLIFCDQETRQFVDSPYPGISYSIIAPETIQNETNIAYSIVVLVDTSKATDAVQDLSAVANIPPGTTFISATGTHSLSEPGKIKWKLYPENSNPSNDGKIILSFTFNLTVKPQNDIVVENLLIIEGASGGAPPTATGIAPNDNYCEDRKYGYVLNNKLLPKNFGDPDCTLDTFQKRNDLYDLIKQKDPQWADFWFNVIIPGESGYRPNAWGCGSWNFAEKECNPPFAPRGAWGLFQMGSSNPPGELKARSGTRGDVTWKEQVDNAINHNKVIDKLGLRFKYWQVAIEWCRDGNLDKPQCRDM